MYQIARRVKREPLSDAACVVLAQSLEHLDRSLAQILIYPASQLRLPTGHSVESELEGLRWQALQSGHISATEKGALLSLLGSVERAEGLVERIVAERASIDRSSVGIHTATDAPPSSEQRMGLESDPA